MAFTARRMSLASLAVFLSSCVDEPKVWPKAVNPDPAELGLVCADVEVLAFAPIGPANGLEMGPCGHVIAFLDGEPPALVDLDGTRRPIGWPAVFSPSGDQLAWTDEIDGEYFLTHRDLMLGTDRITEFDTANPGFGFAPARAVPGSAPALPWSCAGDQLFPRQSIG